VTSSARLSVWRLVGPVAAAKLVLQLLWSDGYGYFRDELYYLACARHLAWGYVDHPPLSVAVLAVEHAALGDSRFALRLVPALAGTAVVLLTGWLARELGGGRVAMVLAAIAALVAPDYLAVSHFYSMNALDLVFWTGAVCIVARILRDPPAASARPWALLGLVLGLGVLDKASVLWLIGGLAVGLLATRHRRLLATPGPWLAILLAAVFVAPHVLWQIDHGWPTREFVQHATEDKMAAVSPLSFLRAQVDDMHPLNAFLWIPGLGALLAWKRLEAFRPLGIAYAAVFALLVINQKSRAGYLSPMYPVLFGAGAVYVEALTRRRRWIAIGFAVLLLLTGAVIAPLALPVLPIDAYVTYAATLGQKPESDEKKEMGPLPQLYADMFGWQEMTDAVAAVVASLSPDERAHAVIRANDYGQAGALQELGHELPPVACGHNNYWLWGPGDPSPSVEVRFGHEESVRQWVPDVYDDCERRGVFESPWVMPYENHLVLYVCRGPHEPLGDRWPKVKHYE
jgi:hypothetical protein